jgi:hypothetical protein
LPSVSNLRALLFISEDFVKSMYSCGISFLYFPISVLKIVTVSRVELVRTLDVAMKVP